MYLNFSLTCGYEPLISRSRVINRAANGKLPRHHRAPALLDHRCVTREDEGLAHGEAGSGGRRRPQSPPRPATARSRSWASALA